MFDFICLIGFLRGGGGHHDVSIKNIINISSALGKTIIQYITLMQAVLQQVLTHWWGLENLWKKKARRYKLKKIEDQNAITKISFPAFLHWKVPFWQIHLPFFPLLLTTSFQDCVCDSQSWRQWMFCNAVASGCLFRFAYFYRGTIGSEARMNANLGVVLFLLSKTFVNE